MGATSPQRASEHPAPSLSIILPAYLSHETIAATLHRLRDAIRELEAEVIVVDSSPDQRTSEQAARFEEVRLIRSDQRLLPHAARNRAAKDARGDCLVFTDPDCLPSPNWLGALVEAHRRGADLVGGPIADSGEGGVLDHAVHLTKFWPWLPGTPGGSREHLPTASMLVSRAVWERHGPFAEDEFSADTRFCLDAVEGGTPVRFEPGALTSHVNQSDLRGFLRERRTRGRDFASMRRRRESWSAGRRALRLLAAPLVPPVLTLRSLRSSTRAQGLARTAPTLPFQLAGFAAWALGETEAVVARTGRQREGGQPPPRSQPLVGHLRRWRSDPLSLLDECALDPAPATRLRIARPTYVLKRPEDVRHVLVAGAEAFPKGRRTSGRAGRQLSAGMLSLPTASSASHRRGRDAIARHLSGSAERYLDRFERVLRKWIAGRGDGLVVDLRAEMIELTQAAMLSSVFGVDHDAAAADRLRAGIATRRSRFARSLQALIPAAGLIRRDPDPGGLAGTVGQLLAAAEPAADRTGETSPSLLQLLAADVRAARLDADTARDELVSIAQVGYLTTAAGVMWALYELLRDPTELAALERELAAVDLESAGDASAFAPARAIVEESLRLHPPSWVFGRVAAGVAELPSGVRIERGAKIFLSPYLIHRLPELWQRPRRFDPSRFRGDRGPQRRFAYLPFGAGRRTCVGRSFALKEMTLILTRVVEAFRLEPRSGEVGHAPGVVLLPAAPIEAVGRRR